MNSRASFLFLFACSCFFAATLGLAADSRFAARATNDVGLDLYRQLATGDNNLCLSPYSIQIALAMTFAGTDGQTRQEMARVLHFSKDDDSLHVSFATLQRQLQEMAKKSAKKVAESGELAGRKESITLSVANRLFAQKGYDFRENFLSLVKERYDAPLEPVDFQHDARGVTRQINSWVLEQTRQRIRDLIPEDALKPMTRLVLVNAIYLNAPWAAPFADNATKPQPFHARGREAVNVPTMHDHERFCGYTKRDGFTVVGIPYIDSDLQLLVLLPDKAKSLQSLEKNVTSAMLAECAKLERRDLNLYLPKFKFEPPTLNLGSTLQALGMKTAFDQPPGSANFDRMAPRKPNDYLSISEVFHKALIEVDESGTVAAAATSVVTVYSASILDAPKPIEVRVDRPFLYAVQHVPSGACLFIGRVTDPR